MEVRIENMIFGWHEKLPEMFIELLNTLVLTKDEQDVRGVMEVLPKKNFSSLLPLRVWRTPFVGAPAKKVYPDQCLETQITDC